MTAVSPLRRVRAAVEAGAGGVAAVAERAGVGRDVAEAALDELVRLGLLRAEALVTACPPGGCGGCGSSSAAGGACGTSVHRPGGPTLVALTLATRPT